ncbi:hypothetical protein B2_7 [Stenotrophomonas phage B2]|nr:hypothetical protein B2_7 [Stenotrophomonas phage B2]
MMKTYTVKDSRYPLGGGAFLVVPGDLVEHPNDGGEWVKTQDVRELLCRINAVFEAAECEGLSQALAETTDPRLKDLVERRLMFAQRFAQDSGLF